jgi:hypothetical protein
LKGPNNRALQAQFTPERLAIIDGENGLALGQLDKRLGATRAGWLAACFPLEAGLGKQALTAI